MGGFLSALGGFGQAAQPYNTKLLDMWEGRRKDAVDTIDSALKAVRSPDLYNKMIVLRGKIAGAKPGDDPSKMLQELQMLTQVHPTAAGALQPQPQQAPPAPAPIGSVPGTLQSMPAPTAPATPSSAPGLIDRTPIDLPDMPYGLPPVPSMSMPASNPLSGGAALPRQAASTSGGGANHAYSPTLEGLGDFVTPMQWTTLQPLVQGDVQHWLNQNQNRQIGEYLVGPNGETLFAPPNAGHMMVPPDTTVLDANYHPVFKSDPRASQSRLQLKQWTDEKGDVYTAPFDPLSGEMGEPKLLGNYGKPQQEPGSFVPIYGGPSGTELKGAVNFKTNRTVGAPAAASQAGDRLGTPVAPAESDRRAAMTSILDDLPYMAQLATKHKDKLGPIAGRAGNLKNQLIGEKDPAAAQEISDLYSLSGKIAADLVKALSGSQAAEQEVARLKKLIPDANTPYNTFMSNLRRFQVEINRKAAQSTGGAIGSGPVTRQEGAGGIGMPSSNIPSPTKVDTTGAMTADDYLKRFKRLGR